MGANSPATMPESVGWLGGWRYNSGLRWFSASKLGAQPDFVSLNNRNGERNS
ncbi:hypothetical protein hamaS1_24550 [Moorella sp. Hama-1]|nr:hypothetical protein hamaS1_24550 [Moorella sp. Hama-1]